MNRKNLMQLLVALTAAAASCGPASAATPQHAEATTQGAASALDVARNAWLECVRAAIPRLDHPESPSAAVARAAMDSCADRYADLVRALSRRLASSCAQDSGCTDNALAKAQSEATQAATDEVVTARIRVAGARVLECQ